MLVRCIYWEIYNLSKCIRKKESVKLIGQELISKRTSK